MTKGYGWNAHLGLVFIRFEVEWSRPAFFDERGGGRKERQQCRQGDELLAGEEHGVKFLEAVVVTRE